MASAGAPAPSGRRGPAIPTPPLDTANAAKTSKRYSYTDTPLELQAPRFNYPATSPTNSTIDESPISPASPSSRVLPIYTEPAVHNGVVTEEKAQSSQEHPPPPPSQMHPAYSAPYLEEPQRQQSLYQRQLQSPTGHGAVPAVHITAPTPLSPNTSALPPNGPSHTHTTSSTSALRPHPAKTPEPKKPAPAMNNIVPDAYAPHSIQGPNISPSDHRPGQVSHPYANTDPHWNHGLCEPSGQCCLGVLAPCVVYGKTQYRLNRKTQHEDPTNLLGHESCNGACGLFALACGFQGFLAAIQRTRIRKAYDIEGDVATDCVKGLCCCCCVVGQDEREMREREEVARRQAGPSRGAYVSPEGGMAYAPPPR